MKVRIETLSSKKIVGKHIVMSFLENKIFELWNSFMPHRKKIKNQIDTNLYSLEVFSTEYFNDFNPGNTFEKWAGIEVNNFYDIPPDMETLTIPTGLYAVFIHKGPPSEAHKTYHLIFAEWLPNSSYLIDQRPHFAVMEEQYKKDDPNSEEEIWIPIKEKI